MTSRPLLVPMIALAALTVSCVSKKDHAALEAQLQECKADKEKAWELAKQVRTRIDDDGAWRDEMKGMISSIPEMKQEFDEERKRILTLVPQEIRASVGERLDRHFTRVNTTLTSVQQDMATMQADLASARDEIAQLKSGVGEVAIGVGTTNETLAKETGRLQAQLGKQRGLAADLVKQLAQFDETYINCADCKERLRMKEESREALRALHGDLATGLSALQAAP